MSKKNKLATRKRAHVFCLEREEKAKQRQEVKALKVQAGSTKAKTRKGTGKLKKGMVVQGIKIVDAESKRKARDMLKADAEAKMDTV